MKTKFLIVMTIIGVLLGSALAGVDAKTCPTCGGKGTITCSVCHGTGTVDIGGTVTCPNCGGTGLVKPDVRLVTGQYTRNAGIVTVTGTFLNQADVGVNGTATASIGTIQNSSPVKYFPPGQTVSISIDLNYIGSISLEPKIVLSQVDNITCNVCSGTGQVPATEQCPNCGGNGNVVCPTCGGTGTVEGPIDNSGNSFSIPPIAIYAIIGAAITASGCIAGFFLIKKRKVNENSLRKLSSSEFQNWVLKRLEARAPSSMDSGKGIDGFTLSGQPLAIRNSESVDMRTIDSFAYALGKSKAKKGVIVAFGYGSDAIRGKVRARTSLGLEIEMVTVRDIIEDRFRS